jgi:hypothetical protein
MSLALRSNILRAMMKVPEVVEDIKEDLRVLLLLLNNGR